MTKPVVNDSRINNELKIILLTSIEDHIRMQDTLFYYSNFLKLFLENKELYEFLTGKNTNSDLNIESMKGYFNEWKLQNDFQFLIYYVLYYLQSTFLELDTYVNINNNEGSGFFQYNLLPITKNVIPTIDNLSYYNSKIFIISHHQETDLFFEMQEIEEVFFNNIGFIDFSKTIVTSSYLKLFLDVLYNQKLAKSSLGLLRFYADIFFPSLLGDEFKKDFKIKITQESTSEEVIEVINKYIKQYSHALGINVKQLTVEDAIIMSPLASPDYASLLNKYQHSSHIRQKYGKEVFVFSEKIFLELSSEGYALDTQGNLVDLEKAATAGTSESRRVSEVVKYFFSLELKSVLKKGDASQNQNKDSFYFNADFYKFDQQKYIDADTEAKKNINRSALFSTNPDKILNEYNMHSEILFSPFDNTHETSFGASIQTTNQFEIRPVGIKEIDKMYKQENPKISSSYKYNISLKENLYKNYETYAYIPELVLSKREIFLDSHPENIFRKMFSHRHSEAAQNLKNISEGTRNVFTESSTFSGNYSRKKVSTKLINSGAAHPQIAKEYNQTLKNSSINNNTLSLINKITSVEEDSKTLLQIEVSYKLNKTMSLQREFSSSDLDVHLMEPIFEVKTINGTLPMFLYSSSVVESKENHDVISAIYRVDVETIFALFLNHDDDKKSSSISHLYNKRKLYNFNLHQYVEKDMIEQSKIPSNDFNEATQPEQYAKREEEIIEQLEKFDRLFKSENEIFDLNNAFIAMLQNTIGSTYGGSTKTIQDIMAQNIATRFNSFHLNYELIEESQVPTSTPILPKEDYKISIPLRITDDTYTANETELYSATIQSIETPEQIQLQSNLILSKSSIFEEPLIFDEEVLYNSGKRNIPPNFKNISYLKPISYKSRHNNIQPRLLSLIYNAFLATKQQFSIVTSIEITSGGEPPFPAWAQAILDNNNPKGYSDKRRKTMRHDLGFSGDIMLKRKIDTEDGIREVNLCLWEPHDDNDFLIAKYFIEQCKKLGAGGIGAGRAYMDYPDDKSKATVFNKSNGIHVDIAYLNTSLDSYAEGDAVGWFIAGRAKLGNNSVNTLEDVKKLIKTTRKKNSVWGESDAFDSSETWLRSIFGYKANTDAKYNVSEIIRQTGPQLAEI